MTIRPAQPADRAEWLRMRCALWPDATDPEVEIAGFWPGGMIWNLPSAVFVIDRVDGTNRLGGFVEASIRPYADGCVTSPVGFVEGWYVDDDLRRRGLGKRLMEAAEQWARSRGCTEMGSDCHVDNDVSHRAHLAMGYRPTEPCLLFAKPLTDHVNRGTREWIGLTPTGLSVGTAVKLVTDPAAGGIDVFLGTTRAERNAAGQELIALDYESYAEMAEQQLRDLARQARQRWPILRLALLHRTGRVPVGEASVLIAVATPHRAESFAACRWLIDTLKAEVAIWKKEVWADGTGTWVHS